MNILVPASGLKTSIDLLSVAGAVVEHYSGSGTLLSVVGVPAERSLSEGALVARRKRALLRRLSETHAEGAFRAEVRTARAAEDGIRDAALEGRTDLLLVAWTPGVRSSVAATLADSPPCDLAAVKQSKGKRNGISSVLVTARGGPHARLAIQIAEAIAARHGAVMTMLHVTGSKWDDERRAREVQFYRDARSQTAYTKVNEIEIVADSVEAALLTEAARHDVIVMGAARRDDSSSLPFGRLADSVARRVSCTAIVAKTREPVTAGTFGLATVSPSVGTQGISQLVDRWFAENTFHSHEFQNIPYLMRLKERQSISISVVLPTLNEESTVGKIIESLKRNLMERYPLVDELIVIDSNSTDRTTEIATEHGIEVFRHADILPEYGSYDGKGEALWKSLQVTHGDIVVWIDSDITNIRPKFVYGLVGPLLTQPDLGFVKGFYRRPLNLGGQVLTTGGGRVTELTARPLINLFYPQLSGLVQPLAGEMAGRREVLESVPFFTGYGVESGLLIDILDRFGLRSIAQSDLEIRVHRNQSLLSLSKMAFGIVQVVVKRLESAGTLAFPPDVSTSMKLIHYSPSELFLELQEIEEHERPPICTLPAYRAGVSEAIEVSMGSHGRGR